MKKLNEKEMCRLAGETLHKLSGPLTGVVGYSQLLLELSGRDNPMRTDLVELEKAAMRCKAIIEDYLKLWRARKIV
jgi:two-component system, NtrC family, sensor kinase